MTPCITLSKPFYLALPPYLVSLFQRRVAICCFIPPSINLPSVRVNEARLSTQRLMNADACTWRWTQPSTDPVLFVPVTSVIEVFTTFAKYPHHPYSTQSQLRCAPGFGIRRYNQHRHSCSRSIDSWTQAHAKQIKTRNKLPRMSILLWGRCHLEILLR